jgi:hypothetical protein
MLRPALFAAAFALLTQGLAGQQHPIVGTWKLSYPAGMRVENGAPTVITGTGTLSVVVKGDSLIGTLVQDPLDDGTRRPDARLTGAAGHGEVTLIQLSKATLNMNGAERQVTSTSTWKLTVAGEEISGTVDRKVEGVDMPSAGPQPVKGSRIKS